MRSAAPALAEKRTKIPLRLAPMPLARRFVQICTTAMAESLEGEDLTPLQYGVLAYVWGEPMLIRSDLPRASV